MIPMNDLVIETSKCIPNSSGPIFHPFQIEEVQFASPDDLAKMCRSQNAIQPDFADLIQQVTYTGPGLVDHQSLHVESREQQTMWEWMFGCFPVLAGRKPPAPLRTYLLIVR